MKLVNYRCAKCGKEFEEIFNDTEDQPEELPGKCKDCEGKVVKTWNIKSNAHAWRWNDNSL